MSAAYRPTEAVVMAPRPGAGVAKGRRAPRLLVLCLALGVALLWRMSASGADPGGVAVEPATEGEGGVLRVKNRTPFIVIMHVGGVRVGWMRPYRTGVIRGLTPGYHKLYAYTQQGTLSWGPKDVWVPGTWTLVQ